MSHPRIAVIIPCISATVPAPVLTAIHGQTRQVDELVVVHGVSPNGRARNQGVAQSSAEWLLFVDDDAVLGHPELIERLFTAAQQPGIVIVGSARILPPDAPSFQRAVANQVARIVHPVVTHDTITNPDPPSFYCDITTTCCLMSRAWFDAVGGFDANLSRGVDSEFFVRARRTPHPAGTGNLLLVANTWVYHPAPATRSALWRKHVAYGIGHAQEVRHDPTRARGGNFFHTPIHAALWLFFRTIIIPIHTVVPYSYGAPQWRIGWYPLKALASYASAIGYVIGWYKL
jgi:GT2 family glycosyltransferase